MTPEDFRRHGRDVVDWIADYMERVEKLPVLSRVHPGDIRAARGRYCFPSATAEYRNTRLTLIFPRGSLYASYVLSEVRPIQVE